MPLLVLIGILDVAVSVSLDAFMSWAISSYWDDAQLQVVKLQDDISVHQALMHCRQNGAWACPTWGQYSHSKERSSRLAGMIMPWSIGVRWHRPASLRTRMLLPLRSVLASRMSRMAILCTSSTGNWEAPYSSQSPSDSTNCWRLPTLTLPPSDWPCKLAHAQP